MVYKAVDFLFLEDIKTLVGSDSSIEERALAAAFMFGKPLKVLDKGADIFKKGSKVSSNADDVKKGGPGVDQQIDNLMIVISIMVLQVSKTKTLGRIRRLSLVLKRI